jgi:sugar lactone lactonase YvrE
LAVNSQSVYWTDYFNSRVMRVPLTGPPDAATLVAAGQSNAFGVAIDSTSVYWTAQGAGHVVKASLTGANLTTIANGSGAIPLPSSMTVDGTGAYWVNERGTVEEVPLGGPPDAATVLATAESPTAIVVDAANVYWTDTQAGTVLRRVRAGGAITTLASAQPSPGGMALSADDTALYWTNSGAGSGVGDGGVGNGTIMKVTLAGGTVTTVAAGQSHPTGIAVDGTTLYWTNAGLTTGTGTVVKLTSGGTPSTLASGLTSPYAIAVDATSVYWTQYEVVGSSTGSSLTRLTPK